MARREKDAYYTPPYMTRALLELVPEIRGNVFEPCCGDNAIADIVKSYGPSRFRKVATNDITPLLGNYCFDAASSLEWATCDYSREIDWVITNPPYDHRILLPIVKNSLQFARMGVAMLLRLSFEEPTRTGMNARGPFLDNDNNRIVKRLVMPRHSFTGDGKSDSVTVAWMIWSNEPIEGWPNVSVHNAQKRFGG